MGLSQNVEWTPRECFSDNNPLTTLSPGSPSSMPHPSTHWWLPGWLGRPRLGHLLCPPAPRAAGTCWRVPGCSTDSIRGAARSRRAWPFPLCKQEAGALTHWACQEEALRWHSCCRRGLFMCRAAPWGGAAPTKQAHRSDHTLSPEDAAGPAAVPPGPLTSISFLQTRPCAGAAFRCNCSKGLWRKEAASWRGP